MDNKRQFNDKTTSVIGLTLYSYFTSVHLHKLMRNCEADATALVNHRLRNIVLKKTFENFTLFFMRNTNTGINHLNFKRGLASFAIYVKQDAYLAARQRKFKG